MYPRYSLQHQHNVTTLLFGVAAAVLFPMLKRLAVAWSKLPACSLGLVNRSVPHPKNWLRAYAHRHGTWNSLAVTTLGYNERPCSLHWSPDLPDTGVVRIQPPDSTRRSRLSNTCTCNESVVVTGYNHPTRYLGKQRFLVVNRSPRPADWGRVHCNTSFDSAGPVSIHIIVTEKYLVTSSA